jgi:hypothetical protein
VFHKTQFKFCVLSTLKVSIYYSANRPQWLTSDTFLLSIIIITATFTFKLKLNHLLLKGTSLKTQKVFLNVFDLFKVFPFCKGKQKMIIHSANNWLYFAILFIKTNRLWAKLLKKECKKGIYTASLERRKQQFFCGVYL